MNSIFKLSHFNDLLIVYGIITASFNIFLSFLKYKLDDGYRRQVFLFVRTFIFTTLFLITPVVYCIGVYNSWFEFSGWYVTFSIISVCFFFVVYVLIKRFAYLLGGFMATVKPFGEGLKEAHNKHYEKNKTEHKKRKR
jgi:hypothetical protein